MSLWSLLQHHGLDPSRYTVNGIPVAAPQSTEGDGLPPGDKSPRSAGVSGARSVHSPPSSVPLWSVYRVRVGTRYWWAAVANSGDYALRETWRDAFDYVCFQLAVAQDAS